MELIVRLGYQLFTSQDPSWIALGTFFLWFGWFGFNGGSTLGISEGKWLVATQAFVNTTVSSATVRPIQYPYIKDFDHSDHLKLAIGWIDGYLLAESNMEEMVPRFDL